MVSRLHYPPRSRKCPQTSRRRQFFGSKFRIIKSRLFTVSQVRHSLIFFLPFHFCWKMERISTWQHWHFHIISFFSGLLGDLCTWRFRSAIKPLYWDNSANPLMLLLTCYYTIVETAYQSKGPNTSAWKSQFANSYFD